MAKTLGRQNRLTLVMQCFIYKGNRKQDTYLYITSEDDFTCVPGPLRDLLGTLEKVMDIDLDKTKKLANADIDTVQLQLKERGFYLQMPPSEIETESA